MIALRAQGSVSLRVWYLYGQVLKWRQWGGGGPTRTEFPGLTVIWLFWVSADLEQGLSVFYALIRLCYNWIKKAGGL